LRAASKIGIQPNECRDKIDVRYQFHNCQPAGRNPHCEAIPQLAQTQLDNSGVEYEAFKVLAGASN
jgi:hypothetical protein